MSRATNHTADQAADRAADRTTDRQMPRAIGRGRDRVSQLGRPSMRPGWLLAGLGLILAVMASIIIATGANQWAWLATQGVALGLVTYVIGVMVGSRHLVAGAGLPVLAAAVVAAGTSDTTAWGRSLAIACLWYASMELAWESIDRRTETKRAPAIDYRRIQEVAMVVVLCLVMGLGSAAVATVAPPRSLLIRAAVIGAVVVALIVATRRMSVTAHRPDPSEDAESQGN